MKTNFVYFNNLLQKKRAPKVNKKEKESDEK